MRKESASRRSPADAGKRQAVVVCAHLRPGRTKRRSKHFMQPVTGLHIASLINPDRFDVALHHEDWHGPYDTRSQRRYDLVFLTGLQADFDRMRQLSFHFRRLGATVVAGGSICTLFPEFAAKFFDVVCVGGVDSVPTIVADFLNFRLQPIYRSPSELISNYRVDYRLFARNGIKPRSHLLEASRGCSFRCSFCVIPAEKARHANYRLPAVAAAIDGALATAPWWSLRRWYPTYLFLDNNFADDRAHMLAVCELMQRHPKVRGWAALLTQDVLRDRDLVRSLAAAKCRALFIGLESLDHDFLRRYNKKQNLSRHSNVIDDIVFAEAQGICIAYGYLFDPRTHDVSSMRAQIAALVRAKLIPMPLYFSLIIPLAGTASFWDDLQSGELAPNLRLRDLDGETIAFSTLADSSTRIAEFVDTLLRRPWAVISFWSVLAATLRRIRSSRSLNPLHWYMMAASNLRIFGWARAYPSARRTYLAGEAVLDPQYSEYPADISLSDWQKYFAPVALTDAAGRMAEWLRPYLPVRNGGRPSV